jgi:hypothetical protein
VVARILGLRALAGVCTASALLLGLAPVHAGAATSIGQFDPGTPSSHCEGLSGWVQGTEVGGPSYVVPAGPSVIVSWSHRANSSVGRELGVRVWRATATVGSYTLVGGGPLHILTPGGINTFQERIPVSGGELLGLRVGNPPTGPFPDVGGGASCEFTAAAGNSVRYGVAASEPPRGSAGTLSSSHASRRLNVTARLEADADADGYGDETQDACPGSAGASSGCPSGNSDLSKDTTRPTVKLRFRRDSIRDGHIGLWVTASEAVRVTARGTVWISSLSRVHRLRTAGANAAANSRVRLSLRMAKKTKRAARRALRHGQRLRARFSVTVRDAGGNTRSAKGAVRLKL